MRKVIAATGNVVTLTYRLRGTNDHSLQGRPATARRFEVHNCTVLEVVEDGVKQVWHYADTLGLRTQLGMPDPA